MTTAQEDRIASVRAVSGSALNYNGDWHALFDALGIPSGTFNERMLAYINVKFGLSFTNVNDAMNYLALQNGATNFSSMGTFDASVSLKSVIPSAVFDVDATQLKSYSGSGQIFANMIAAPADGSTQTANDFQFGTSQTPAANDPTFVGPAGSKSAYMSFDGGDLFTIANGNTAFIEALHKTSVATPHTLIICVNPVDQVAAQTLMGTSTSSASRGVRILLGSNERVQYSQRGDSANVTSNSTLWGALTPGTPYLIIYSTDGAGNLRSWVNSLVKQEETISLNASTGAAANTFRISNLLENGSRVYAAALLNSYIDTDEATKIFAFYNTRHNRTYVDLNASTGIIVAGQSNAERLYTYGRNQYSAEMTKYLTAIPNYLIDGATGGTALVKSNAATGINDWWYDPATLTFGPAYTNFLNAVSSYPGTIRGIHWDQGESDQDVSLSTAKRDEYKSALLTVFTAMRTLIGDVPIFISKIGRRGDAQNTEGYQVIREIQREMAAENSWCHILPEKIIQEDDGGAHLSNAGYGLYAPQAARKMLAVTGVTVSPAGVDGPTITNAVRVGTVITVTIAHDGGTDFTPTTGIEGFRYFTGGSGVGEIAILSAVRTNATTITLTLASGAAGTLYYGWRTLTGVNRLNLVRDNAADPLPLVTSTISVA